MSDKQYPIGGYAPGNYHCTCCKCGVKFNGDKRAVECEPCAVAAKEKFDALTPEEQEEVRKRNIETWNELVKNNSSNEQLSGADQVCGKTELNNLATISKPQSAVWVKASVRLPDTGLIVWRWQDKTEAYTGYKEKTGFHFGTGGARVDPTYYSEIEWLDEQATTSNKDEAMAFAEFAVQKCWFDEEYRLWNTHDETEDPFRFTTPELWDLWQQSKQKP